MTPPPTSRPRRRCAKEPSPARSDSSVSLGTHWHISPKKKRRYYRKRKNTSAEEEQAEPRKRRARPRTRPQASIQTTQDEHITTTQVDPESLSTPITVDSPPPRLPSISPFKPRANAAPKPPGMRINLESARLETIQAQESARGYDIYHPWPTPPSSAKSRVGNVLSTPITSPYSEPRAQLYASSTMGSSTGPGTRERERVIEEQSWRSARLTAPPKPDVPLKHSTLLGPLTHSRFFPILAEPLEAELDTVGPEVNKLARLGLQTALGKLAERYEFPLDNVSKLYRSKGCLEETERVLRQLRRTENELKELKHAAFGKK